ncbi:MAG: PD-(D/E)XK nuclease family protein [Planctomycetota bacterium]|jgi:CRISPR/Cas system-associated exonuclease Cas4 (RecB family)|nr:PD-(D/E)XK nuclease family protein [Planctomycetota bacterium]
MTTLIHEPQSRSFLNTHPRTRALERTPRETARQDQPHISASQLRSYAGCPLAWRLSRTHRPEHIPAALIFGSAFHAAAERFYQMRLEGKTAAFNDLMEAYDAKWQERGEAGDGGTPPPVKFPAKTGPMELRQTAVRMLEAFLAHANANAGEVIAVEEEFLAPMAPGLPALKGRIDLVEIRTAPSGNRRLHLVDFKTAAKRMRPEDIDRDQMDLYALALRRTGLLDELQLPLVLRVDMVTKVKEPEVIPVDIPPDKNNEKRVIAKAREIWKCMASGVCYPAPSWQCGTCGYKTLCGKWPDIPESTGRQDHVQ